MSANDARVILQKINRVVVVPVPDLVGNDFFAEVKRQLLDLLQREQVTGIILDLTGVELLDAHDFRHLQQTWQSTRLMGCATVLAGIKPGVAAALSMLDVHDEWVTTALSVELAMEKLR